MQSWILWINVFLNNLTDNFKLLTFKSFFLFGSILFLTFNAGAQVAVDSSSSGGAFSQTGVPAFSWNHTVTTSGNNRVLYVGVSTTSDAASATIFPTLCSNTPAICSTSVPIPNMAVNRVISVEFNEVALERVGSRTSSDFQYVVEVFRLVNPPTGMHLVEVDLVDGLASNAVGGSVSFIGADEPPMGTIPTFYSNSGNNSNPSLTVTGEAGRSGIALGVVATSPNAGFIGDTAGQVNQYEGRTFFFNSYDVGKGSTKSANPSATFNWNLTNTTNIFWATGGVFVRSFPASASPASIGGQVKTKDGIPLKNVLIRLENLQTGEIFHTNTNEKGVYYLEGLTVTNIYQIKAYSNFYVFSPNNRVFDLTESLEGIDFQGTKRNRKNWFIRNQ